MTPTLSGYIAWIRAVMGINITYLPDASPSIQWTYSVAVEIASLQMACISTEIYMLMVYNLAGDYLLNYAQDQPGQTYFSDLRKAWNLTGFVPGVITSSADVSTSESLLNPDFMKNFSMSELQNLKTPYGRQYLAFAQMLGEAWGIS
ncbi:MAG: hypothetical protein V4447_10690 [Pseudomonadota bacterium]